VTWVTLVPGDKPTLVLQAHAALRAFVCVRERTCRVNGGLTDSLFTDFRPNKYGKYPIVLPAMVGPTFKRESPTSSERRGFDISSQRIIKSRLTSGHGDYQKERPDSTKIRSKAHSNPACDLHINLQMEATTFMTPTGRILGYICPVPSCRRRYNGFRYFREPEAADAIDEGFSVDPCASSLSESSE